MLKTILLFTIILYNRIINSSPPSFRIIGGEPADILNFPYHLKLRIRDNQVCAASIIASNLALTAAHCFIFTGPWFVETNTTYLHGGGKEVYIERVIVHPKFVKGLYDYDIAILFLEEDFKFGPGTQPIKLADVPPKTGDVGVVVGWGQIFPTESYYSENLKKLEVTVIDWEICEKDFGGYDGAVTERMFCAVAPGQDACKGDSGGGLVINHRLAGLVSWSIGCARPEYPGVYTNIAELRDFIKEYAGL